MNPVLLYSILDRRCMRLFSFFNHIILFYLFIYFSQAMGDLSSPNRV